MKKAVVLLCSLLLLAGCGAAPAESLATPAPTATATPTPLPATPTPTPMPTPEPTPEVYIPGVLSDQGYTNTSLGFHFVPTEDMVLATEEEMAAMLQNGVDLLSGNQPSNDALHEQVDQIGGYEMVAFDVLNGGSVMVLNEAMPLEGITEDQYIRAIQKQLTESDLPVEITLQEEASLTLGQTAFQGITYTLTTPQAPGVQAYQTVVVKRVADRMCAVAFSYAGNQQYAAMLACFQPISAI